MTTRAIKYVAMAPGSTPAEVAFCERIVSECHPAPAAVGVPP